ncbi:MAG: serine hydrolase domain-containing protein, partial [Pseudomonadota bacterium]
ADAVTVRHLLSHTSGLGNRTYTADYTAHSPFNAEISLSQLAQANLAFKPGTAYQYSNAGMTLLALIVERVSGESREDYVRRQILAPAGMSETQFLWNLSDDDLNAYTAGYVQSGANIARVESRGHVTASFGSGDIVSTLGDLRKWHLALKSGSLLSESSLAEMVKPVVLADGSRSERGLAFMIGEAQGERFVYNSGDLYTHTRHAFFLHRDISVIVNANVDIEGNFDLAGRVRDQIIAKLENTPHLEMYGEAIDVRGDY